ncbi:hypothetical protein V6N11_051620 [Hibiscus sabdariffa]|uniref:Uncharacterized protein n=1 Tax=Hibiscus sabdariffa TaxID=183260 RepID=A0ABR2U816_9ROSI
MMTLVQGSATMVLGPVVCLLFYDGTRPIEMDRCFVRTDLEQRSAILILFGQSIHSYCCGVGSIYTTKGVWLLLVGRHSLVSRILASKFFPHSTVLEAQLDDKPSAIWRSINKDFVIPSHNGWDIAKVREVFTPVDAEQILQCSIASRCFDLLVWGNHSSRTYSTRSGYAWLMKHAVFVPSPPKVWHTLAKLKTLLVIRIFI